MFGGPWVTVRDRETGHVYDVSEARFKRTPELWERVGPNPVKPRTTVAEQAAKKKASSRAEIPTPDPDQPVSVDEADKADKEE